MKTLIHGANLLSMSAIVGDIPNADVVVEDDKIVSISKCFRGKSKAALPAEYRQCERYINAENMIMIPGFVDTHRHCWETALRNIAVNSTLADYFRDILGKYAPRYKPEDVFVSNKFAAISAIDSGITQLLDWSHIQNSEDHTVAALNGLSESGIRYVFAYGTPMDGTNWWDPTSQRQHPQEVFRSLSKLSFENGKLALAARGVDFASAAACKADWAMARECGARITVHVNGKVMDPIMQMEDMNLLGPDVTLIHCGGLVRPEHFRLVRDSGSTVSIAPQVEMMMGHGYPPFQACARYNVQVSLSTDVETTVPGDMFTQMRFAMAAHHQQELKYPSDILPRLITARDVLKMATRNGAMANGMFKTGMIKVGYKADLVLLDPNRSNIGVVNDPYGAVLSMDTSNVSVVMINGKIMKQLPPAPRTPLTRDLIAARDRITAGDQ